jgi:hypothetical protein
MVTCSPAGSLQPVTANLAGAFPGEAATQIVSDMWLTKVTCRWPLGALVVLAVPADDGVPRPLKAPDTAGDPESTSNTGKQ